LKPNILLMVLDCTRADHLSCYGYPRPTTPFLDALAAEGTLFENMSSCAPWTLPSHASLFTGEFPTTHGATDEHRRLGDRLPTLAELLRETGYVTAAFCANPWVSRETGLGRGFDSFFSNRRGGVLGWPLAYVSKAVDVAVGRRDSGSFHTNRAFAHWLAGLKHERPFFAFVHYNETHLRYHPPARFRNLFVGPSDSRSRIRRLNQDCNAYLAGAVSMSDDDFRLLAALYDGELRHADSRLEQIAGVLQDIGRWEDTLVIVTADHGENLGEHGLMSHKFCLYETLLRVPLVLRGPGIPRGVRSPHLAQNVDVLPTVAAAAGVPAPRYAQVAGVPLLECGRPTSWREHAFAERYRPNLTTFVRRYPRFDPVPVDVRRRAVSDGRWKLIVSSDGHRELYDLATDRAESANLAEARADQSTRLEGVLEEWLRCVERRSATVVEDPEFDRLARRQLAGLGYID